MARSALVTGAGGGLGSAVCELLRRDGLNVTAVDLDEDALGRAGAASDERLHLLLADLSDIEECDRVMNEHVRRWGQVDVLVNCAAIFGRTKFDELDAARFDSIVNINLRSVFWLCRGAIADMVSRKSGRIVNVTTVGVHTGGYAITSAVYDATKGGVDSFTKTLARHVAPDGILVNAVAPGAMRTRMILEETPADVLAAVAADIPLGRLAEPSEVAEVIAFLASERNTYATGATFDVNGGMAMP